MTTEELVRHIEALPEDARAALAALVQLAHQETQREAERAERQRKEAERRERAAYAVVGVLVAEAFIPLETARKSHDDMLYVVAHQLTEWL